MSGSGDRLSMAEAAHEACGVGVRVLTLLLAVAAPVYLSGCQKKAKALVLPQSQAPVVLVTPPPADHQAMIEVPQVKVPPVPVASAGGQPKRERRRPAKPTAGAAAPPAQTPPAQVASAEVVGEGSNAIGALTAGGDAGPQAMQQATELIASNEKRLKQMAEKTVKEQQVQISKVKNFQRQALDALRSGDAEGAKTLATKALLLLNDLERGGGG